MHGLFGHPALVDVRLLVSFRHVDPTASLIVLEVVRRTVKDGRLDRGLGGVLGCGRLGDARAHAHATFPLPLPLPFSALDRICRLHGLVRPRLRRFQVERPVERDARGRPHRLGRPLALPALALLLGRPADITPTICRGAPLLVVHIVKVVAGDGHVGRLARPHVGGRPALVGMGGARERRVVHDAPRRVVGRVVVGRDQQPDPLLVVEVVHWGCQRNRCCLARCGGGAGRVFGSRRRSTV